MADPDILAAVAEGRAAYQEYGMPDRGELLDTPATDDNAGGSTAGTPRVIAAFPCRIEPLGGGAEQVIAERIGATRARKVTLPLDVEVKEAHQLRISGDIYEVAEIAEREGAYAVAQVVYARRML